MLEGFKINILLVALALALDAGGVAMAVACGTKTNLNEKLKIILSFGFFQFFFAYFGALAGNYIDKYFFTISNYLSGTVLLLLALFLLREGYKSEEECIYTKLNFWTIIILGVSVSIDALGAGFSLLFDLDYFLMFYDSLIIGLIASLITALSFKVINYIRHITLVEKYVNYIGGIILLTIALNTLLK